MMVTPAYSARVDIMPKITSALHAVILMKTVLSAPMTVRAPSVSKEASLMEQHALFVDKIACHVGRLTLATSVPSDIPLIRGNV